MKKFAKLVSIILVSALLFAMVVPMSASAAEEKVTIKVETVNSTPGSKGVEVKVFVTADPTWSALALTFNFDVSKITYKSFALNPALVEQNGGGEPNVFVLNKNNAAAGEVIVQLASAVVDGGYEGYHNTDSDGNSYDYLGTFKFDVKADAEGLAEINAKVDKANCMRSGTVGTIATEVTNGGIQLPEEIKVNFDDGAEFNLYSDPAPAATWTPANATATLNGAAYTAGTAISDVGEYTLVVTDGTDSKSISFTVINQEPPFEGVDMVIETVAAKAGDKGVQVKVFVPAEPHWSAIALTFKFDSTKMTYKSFALNPALIEQNGGGEPNVFVLNKNNASKGEVIVQLASAVVDGGYEGYHNTDSDGNSYDYLGTFKFDIPSTAEDGLIELSAKIDKMNSMVEGETVVTLARIAAGGVNILGCAHKWLETGRTPATCTEKGTINYTCEYDSTHTKTEDIEIDADAHDWTGNWVLTKNATCSAKGEETLCCKHNNAHTQTRDVEIDPDAHDFGDWEVFKAATTTAKGEERRYCKDNPDHYESREYGPIVFDGVSIRVETVSAKAGDKAVEVKVFVTSDPTWSALALTFNFDVSKLTYKNFALNPALVEQNSGGEPNVFVLNKNNASSGEVIVQLASAVVDGGYEGYHNVDSDGNAYDYLGTFKFDVKADVEGLAEINAKVDKANCMRSGTVETIATDVTNGGIQLPEEIKVNFDDGAEFNLYTDPAPAATWTPAAATATLNGEAYTAGTPIAKVGEYTLVVTNGSDSKSISFTVINQEPPYEGVDMVIETVSAKPGDKNVEVKVFVPAEPHWSAIALTFNFNPAKLTYKSFALNPALIEQNGGGEPNVFVLNKNNASSGEVIVQLASAVVDGGYEGYHNVDSDGNAYDYLGTFKFNVADDVDDGLIELSATIDKMNSMVEGETVVTLARIAAGGIEITSCAHYWVETGRTPATCTDKGTIFYTCVNDPTHTKTEDIDIDPDAHDWGNWETTQGATCVAKGTETRVCKNNPAHTETRDIEIDETAHAWGNWETTRGATCVAKGTETRVCNNNPAHIETRDIEIDATAHNWGAWTANTDATCIAKATEIRVCNNDPAHTEIREVGEIDETAHAWGKWETTQAATCSAKGTETRVCNNDPAHTETRDIEIDETAHDWGDWEVTTPATPTQKGEETRYCKNNPAHFETREVSYAGNVPVTIETVNAGSGTKNVEVKVSIPAVPHWSAIGLTFNFDSTKMTFKSFMLNPALVEQIGGGEPNVYVLNKTNAANGEISIGFASAIIGGGYEGYHNVDSDGNAYDYFGTFKFDISDEAPEGLIALSAVVDKISNVVEGVTVDATSEVTDGGVNVSVCKHKWIEVIKVPATCTSDGIIYYICENDSTHMKTEILKQDPEAHDWVEISRINPTCGAEGTVYYVCKNDGTHTKTEHIEALQHNWGEWQLVKAATCSAKGIESRFCKNDGTHYETREIEIDPDAHVWSDWQTSKPATCSAEGTEVRVCLANPSHIEVRNIEIDPNTHDWGEWESVSAATCAKKAVEMRVCKSNSAHFELREVGEVAYDAHDWGKWQLTSASNCTTKGSETRICKNDPTHIETRELEIDPEAHAWGEWQLTLAATCSRNGIETRICGNNSTHIEIRELELDSDAHDWGEWQVAKAATCVAKGLEIRICKNNLTHFEIRDVEVDSNAHSWSEWMTVTPATYAQDGLEIRTCGNDTTHLETRAIPMLTTPALSISDGAVFDIDNGDAPPAVTWEPSWATATLDGKPYVSGTAISADGEHVLVVTNGSYTETVTFTVINSIPSIPDMDGDGKVTVADSLAVLRIAVKLTEQKPTDIFVCDMDGDGKITVADSLAILRIAVKLV